MYKKLFSPGQIGNLTLKNRLVMSPMGTGLANLDGTPSDDMIAYYEARAIGGAGLIIPEITRINDVHGIGMLRQLSVTQDYHIKPLARLADAVHKHGSKIFIQLQHPGREGISALMGGQPVVSASAIPCKQVNQETRALTVSEIQTLIKQYVDGAVRVQKAGCDGVELHAAHGYLLQQFLSPYTNKRTDEYGGNFENRLRMISEIISRIRAQCGADFPVGVRLSVEEFLDKTGVTDAYIHLQDGIKIAMALQDQGIDFIDVSVGLYETGMTCIEPISFAPGWRRDLIKAVKNHVTIPVIGVSVIREPAMAEKFLQDGVEDFISMGRSWLADKDWGKKAAEGRENELRKCISCLHCSQSMDKSVVAGTSVECSQNPSLGHELEYAVLPQDLKNRTIVVIGAGPAGMAAAEILAERGSKVILFDRNSDLGGAVNIAKLPPHKEHMGWHVDYYRAALKKLNVTINLKTEVTTDMLLALKPDAVLIATGSTPIVPSKIPGIHGENVYTIESILSGKTDFSHEKIVLIGAGMTGIETAAYLARKSNQLTIVDMNTQVAADANPIKVADVCHFLEQYHTSYLLGHALKEIRSDFVVLEKLTDHSEVSIPATMVVLSLGNIPDNKLAKDLQAHGIKVTAIGNAVKDGTIKAAVHNSYQTALNLFR
ncbi:NADH oxidase [Sporomusa silvacetica DSM 10669]|uniref:NADH oxidase n=1 Tax=Sporomusa silvacetica DSM 10669 TaxID=1123289 RepID=A0ABZ3IHM1_9FIRM|nr:FAD-dependent oxidoreductase [Sporomusa silvacetica]OZC13073.1 NADH oxidase [Sporomusa silvacetica DSM 10669]